VSSAQFRAGVIVVVRRADGAVLAFERAADPGSWQFPQGGIEQGEEPIEAAWRELYEETGLDATQVRHVHELPIWTVQEWPATVRRGRRLGQVHRWFVFEAPDDVTPVPDGHEFVAWRWVDPQWLADHVIDFKQPSYRAALAHVADEPWARP
jgi:putative (di)nucleoside polyphosphate hydrolase